MFWVGRYMVQLDIFGAGVSEVPVFFAQEWLGPGMARVPGSGGPVPLVQWSCGPFEALKLAAI